MSLQRTYRRRCDGCGAVHKTVCETARRSLAAARRDGWVRRNIVTGRVNRPDYAYSRVTNSYEPTGEIWSYDITAGRDFCPECAEKEVNQ